MWLRRCRRGHISIRPEEPDGHGGGSGGGSVGRNAADALNLRALRVVADEAERVCGGAVDGREPADLEVALEVRQVVLVGFADARGAEEEGLVPHLLAVAARFEALFAVLITAAGDEADIHREGNAVRWPFREVFERT